MRTTLTLPKRQAWVGDQDLEGNGGREETGDQDLGVGDMLRTSTMIRNNLRCEGDGVIVCSQSDNGRGSR